MKRLLTTLILFSCCLRSTGQDMSQFTDPRDGKLYPTVRLTYQGEGDVPITKEWFARNLDYVSDQSYCYKSGPAYCEVFGRLYPWEGAQGACPGGWHLPTSGEWHAIIDAFGGLKTAGAELNESGSSGLNLQMGGFGDNGGQYFGIGASGYYWALRENGSELITIDASTDEILYNPIGSSNKNSIRCVRDQ